MKKTHFILKNDKITAIPLYKAAKTWYNNPCMQTKSFLTYKSIFLSVGAKMQKCYEEKRPGAAFRFVKRTADIFFSSLVTLILSPILLIISLVILLTDGRPIVFAQWRIGLDGQPFKCYKFRTMTVEAPHYMGKSEITNPEQYITKFGKFLRRTSLDELPQLINIIKGDMSLIGPRPIIKEENNLQELRRQAGIYAVRPGLTGYAQVCGRNDLDDETKVRYDKYYLDHISVWMDIKVLFMTFGVVLLRKGEHEGAAMSLNDPDSSLLGKKNEKDAQDEEK